MHRIKMIFAGTGESEYSSILLVDIVFLFFGITSLYVQNLWVHYALIVVGVILSLLQFYIFSKVPLALLCVNFLTVSYLMLRGENQSEGVRILFALWCGVCLLGYFLQRTRKEKLFSPSYGWPLGAMATLVVLTQFLPGGENAAWATQYIKSSGLLGDIWSIASVFFQRSFKGASLWIFTLIQTGVFLLCLFLYFAV